MGNHKIILGLIQSLIRLIIIITTQINTFTHRCSLLELQTLIFWEPNFSEAHDGVYKEKDLYIGNI